MDYLGAIAKGFRQRIFVVHQTVKHGCDQEASLAKASAPLSGGRAFLDEALWGFVTIRAGPMLPERRPWTCIWLHRG